MAVQVTLTDEQARWLSTHIGGMLDDWSWNGRNRPDADVQEHASTIKRKVDAGLADGGW